MNSSPEKQGDKSLFMNSDCYKRDVNYRQCRNIQKRGPTEAICLHENKNETKVTKVAICLKYSGL